MATLPELELASDRYTRAAIRLIRRLLPPREASAVALLVERFGVRQGRARRTAEPWGGEVLSMPDARYAHAHPGGDAAQDDLRLPTFHRGMLEALSDLEGQSSSPAATASTMRKGPPVLITVLSRKPAAFKSPSS